MKSVAMRFRWFIIVLVSLASVVTLFVSGMAIFWVKASAISQDAVVEANETVRHVEQRTEQMLASVEQTLITLAHASILMDRDKTSIMLLLAMASQPLVRTMYLLDGQGRTFAVWANDSRWPQDPDFVGIDFSLTPLYRSLEGRTDPVWSDKFVSTLRGDTSIGVGIRVGSHTAIAELELATLLKAVETPIGSTARLTVLDRHGEVLVDTGARHAAGVLNLRHDPVVAAALAGTELPRVGPNLQGSHYHPAAARSKKLGWLFIAGIPAGIDNPNLKGTLMEILLLSGSFLLTALALSPFWSKIIASQVDSLRILAGRIADGHETVEHQKGPIHEFNTLSRYLRVMADRVRERETALQALNRELEQRVAERTKDLELSNQDLRESLDHNTKIQELLVQTEKLAALGRLVAGVAHEMNTPIGNAVMAISTLKEEQVLLGRRMADGLRRSDLDSFLTHTEQGLEIASRNVDRAAELISSFKHVASDQASAVRRTFELSEMIRDVLLTLHPMLKRSPHKLETDIEEGLKLDSYPGVIGQILTNLVTNALLHAWEDGQEGHLAITVRSNGPDGRVRISVRDDGKGIPEAMRRKVFEPFFTTRMGRGGTGLGLNIAYNGARNVLGGRLDFEVPAGGGTVFILDIPLIAPVLKNAPLVAAD
jgi:signal transduction histidine kinase